MIKIKIKVEEGGIGCSMKMRVMEETILKCDRIIIVLINLLQEKNMSSPPRELKSRPRATNACTCNNHLLLILLILVMVFLLVMVGYDDGDGAHHVIGSSDCVLGGADVIQ